MTDTFADPYEEARASLVTTEEVQITVHVRGNFWFAFCDYPVIPSFLDMVWISRTLDNEDARLNLTEVGAQMLRQLLSLQCAVSLKATPEKITVTFAFMNRKHLDLDFFQRQAVAIIAFYLTGPEISVQEGPR